MFLKRYILHPIKLQWYNLQIAVGGAWRLFCKQQREQEKRLIAEHYQETDVTDDHVVVFTCNGRTWHGGLADRLKGIVAVYDWCRRNNRAFSINFCSPFHLQDYVIPSHYDWLPKHVVYNQKCSEPRVCLMEPRTCEKKEVRDYQDELLEIWMNENLFDETKQLHVYTNMFRTCVDFSLRFNELFKPCERLQKEIDWHLQQIGGKYISISFRFTTLLGDFTDCTGSPLSEDKQVTLINQSLKAIEHLSAMASAHDMILVTADSEKFLAKAKKQDHVYVIPGKVGHIDYDHGDDVNMKTFLDFFMISKAEIVYLAKGPGMYNSAFAKTAAMVNNRPFEAYEY